VSRPMSKTDAASWRYNRVLTIGMCELCESTDLSTLALHEIVRGGLRQHVYTNPALTLCLCNGGKDCHSVVSRWSRAKQLCLLRWRRPDDFSLAAHNRWAAALELADVVACEAELISELVHESF
jgi:hypothetical protein